MAAMKHIVMLVLTLAALVGLGAHEVAASKMSIEMTMTSATEGHDAEGDCPACGIEAAEKASACDMDCTTSAFNSVAAPFSAPAWATSAQRFGFTDMRQPGRTGGLDPLPPRDIILI